jgi:uncharacterized damage-inducible protein DinB
MVKAGLAGPPIHYSERINDRQYVQSGEIAMNADFGEVVRSALIVELEELHNGVKQTVDTLTDEQLWRRPLEPSNSIGHLVLHLTGNLNHFVGAQLGKTGYVRDREREFTETNLPGRETLVRGLDEAVATFTRVVSGLDVKQLTTPHPETRFGTVTKTLIHLVAHFALHRGQISYLARLVKKSPG